VGLGPGALVGCRPVCPFLDPDVRLGGDRHQLADLDGDGPGELIGQLHVHAVVEHGDVVAQTRGRLAQVGTPGDPDALGRPQAHPAYAAGREGGQGGGQQEVVVDGDLHRAGQQGLVGGVGQHQGGVHGRLHGRHAQVLGAQSDRDLADGDGVPGATA
jgi:hypothetical protein